MAFALSRAEGWARSVVERELARALDAEVTLGRFDLDLWNLGVEFTDLRAERAPGSGAPLRLHVGQGSVRAEWRGLLGLRSGGLRLAELRLVRPLLAFEAGPGGSGAAGAGDPVSLDVRIGRLVVQEGRLSYADRQLPVEIEATDVGLRGSWGGNRRALVGEVRFDLSIMRPPLRRPLQLAVDSGFRWRGDRVEWLGMSAEGSGLRLELDAELAWGDEPRWEGRGRFDVDAARLYPSLDPDLPEMEGTLTAGLVLKGQGAAWEARGDFEARDARVDPFRASTARGGYVFRPGRLTTEVAEARIFGGTVSGLLDFELGTSPRLRADLEGRGLHARALLAQFGLSLPLDAHASAAVKLEGPLDQTSEWSVDGTFDAAADRAGSGVPFDAAGRVAMGNGTLRIASDRVRAGSAAFALEATMEGAPSGRVVLSLDGETRDAAATQHTMHRLLGALELQTPEIMGRPLAGAGTFRCRVETGTASRVDLELDLGRGSFGPASFDRLGLALAWDGHELALPRFEVERGPERLAGSARLAVDPFALRELSLTADRFAVGSLLAAIGVETDLHGTLAGRVDLERGGAGEAGTGWVSLTQGSWFDEEFERAESRIEISDGRWRFPDVVVTAAAFEAQADATWDVTGESLELDLRRAVVEVAELGLIRRQELPVRGDLALSGKLSIDGRGIFGELWIDSEAWEVGGYAIGGFRGTAGLQPEEVALNLAGAGWQGTANVVPSSNWPVTAGIRLDGFETELGSPGAEALWANLTGQAQLRGGLAGAEELTIEGTLEQVTVGLGSRRFSATEVPIAFDSARWEAGPIRLQGPAGEVEARVLYEPGTERVEGSCAGHLDLGLIAALLPEVRGSGRAAIDVAVAGTLEQPELRGSVRLSGARLRRLGFPQVLEQLEARADFTSNRVEIREMRAVTGGGELQGSGELIVDLGGVRSHRLEFSGTGIRVGWPEGFDGVYDARLVWAGTPDESTIRGNLFLLRGLYKKNFDIGGLLGSVRREYAADESQELPANVRLDIDLSASGDVWVRNDLLQSEASLDLQIGGDLRRPQVAGRISLLEDGKIRYRNVEYRIVSGTVDFTDPDRIHPYVSLAASTSVGNYDILLRVEGYPERFEYEMTSTPTLSQQDIIALLATGRTLEDLGSEGRTGFTGDLATNYFAGALTGKFERQLQDLLNVERLRIDPLLYEGSADPTTRITVGKEVADDVMVIISSDLGSNERQLYQIEWKASRRLRLTTQRDTTGGIGGDLFYTGRIARNKPVTGGQAAPANVSPQAASETEQVSGVRLEGVTAETAEPVRRRLRLAPGDAFRRSEVFAGTEAIRRFYVEQGRLQVEVRSRIEPAPEPERGVFVVYTISPGPLFRVELEGVAKQKDRRRLLNRLEGLWTSQLFGEDLYADAEEQIASYYREQGFYAVAVQHALEREGDRFLLRFEVDPGKPVRVATVAIEGADQVPVERVRRQILTRPATLLARRTLDIELLEQDLRAVRNLYLDLGFLQADVERPQIRLSSSSDAADVTIRIREGPRFTIGRLMFSETGGFPQDELISWTGLALGDGFSPSALLEAESAVRAELDRRGYPDARVRSKVTRNDDTVDIEFTLQPDQLKFAGEIVVVGNRRTRERVVRQAIALDPGDPISRAKILETQHRLYRLNLFSNVRISYGPTAGADPTRQRVEVRVEEAPPVSLTVGVGYDTEGKGRASFAVSHDNLGGAAREGKFEAQASGILTRFQLLGRVPTMFGSRLPGTATLFWEDREETGFNVKRFSGALRVDRELSPKWKGFARYGFQTVDVTDVTDIGALQDERLENAELGDFGITLVRDTRDDPLAATRGTFFSFSGRLFAKPLLSESSFLKTALTWGTVTTFANRTAYVVAARVGTADPFGSTTEVPISERFFAGGDSTLRGFPRNDVGPDESGVPVGGGAMFLLNQEFRYPIWGQLRGVVFYDAGNVYERPGDLDLTDLRHVLGLGLRLETPIGPLRLEYGRKLDREPTESSGELFLAIGTIF